MKKLFIFGTAFILSACASNVPLPENAAVTKSGSANYLEKVDFSKNGGRQVKFSKLKICIAENISNDAVTLNDAAGSWVGPATGTYYKNSNTQVISGNGIFKYIDDQSLTLIANGTTSYSGGALIAVTQFVKFDLKSSIKTNGYSLIFSKITRAQKSTGILSNSGFDKVGTWSGADASGVYAQLKLVAASIDMCVRE